MTDETPTIEEAVEQASQSLESSSEEALPESEEEKEVEPAEETPQESPDKEVQEEKEESAEYGVDPEKLPEELKPIYEEMKRNMDKGFTQNRQKDREELNELKKELAQLKRGDQELTREQLEQLTPEEQIERLAEQKVLEKRLDDFRETALEEYPRIDSRLDRTEGNEKYDELMDVAVSTQLDKMLEDHIAINGNELGFDYKSHAKELVKQWDQYLESDFDRRISRQRELAKKKEAKAQKANPKTSKAEVKASDSMGLEQAINAALDKVG